MITNNTLNSMFVRVSNKWDLSKVFVCTYKDPTTENPILVDLNEAPVSDTDILDTSINKVFHYIHGDVDSYNKASHYAVTYISQLYEKADVEDRLEKLNKNYINYLNSLN